ncbi:Hypothetical predicted protein [Olea europaea subsp. europaea]|uniref:Heme-binding protein 2-like n=1 Tax=Olea europaea subsp. europaea TaxID=158383 RepID=A0A8S0RZ89_OLEEU|nr:Hypothetical predicted protein [Olea europaea subsp. europaea]
MASLNLFNLSFLLSLLSSSNLSLWPRNHGEKVGVFPPTCNRIECPNYDVIHTGNGFEIRRYNSSTWISTSPIDDISFVGATRDGFLRLFSYIQGNNSDKRKIEMTAPVITEVKPSDGSFCASSFVVSFYVPKENQQNPPSAKDLHVQKWGLTYVAVRQFGGFVDDDEVGEEAAALYASIAGTIWSDAIDKSYSGGNATEYIVAQYNSPFEFRNRVNEIWLTFDLEDGFAI